MTSESVFQSIKCDKDILVNASQVDYSRSNDLKQFIPRRDPVVKIILQTRTGDAKQHRPASNIFSHYSSKVYFVFDMFIIHSIHFKF